MLEQYFDLDDERNMTVTNIIDTSKLEKLNAAQRKENPKGWTNKKNWMHVARFYPFQIKTNKYLSEWWENRNKDPKYAAACLARYLEDNPTFKVSDSKIATPRRFM